ncbi:MAG TPA: hypothetical protein VFD27_05075 [Chthoniobacteraceae bacterium]|nr:hypothetical protein [Chthoniobacteraceae bacterium]
MHIHRSSLESLEPRIAPARILGSGIGAHTESLVPAGGAVATQFDISSDGKAATWVNTDGDTVSLAITKGKLKPANFDLTTDSATGEVTVNLFDISAAKFGAKFQGTSIDVKIAAPSTTGFADIRAINAKGIDVGRVTVGGDLGQIDAGDADLSTPAIRRLQVGQMGFFGVAGQIAGQDTMSKIRGPVVKLQLDELLSAFINVVGGSAGSIDQISIGTMDGAREEAMFDGSVRASGPIGEVSVGGEGGVSIAGGVGDFSGVIWSRKSTGQVLVAGDLVGGDGFYSGAIFAGNPDKANPPLAGKIGPVTIHGSILGGAGDFSGTLYSDTKVKAVAVDGSVVGGDGMLSGSIVSGGGFAGISIGGNLESSTGGQSGSIVAFNGDAPSITIEGQIVAGNFAQSGIHINGFLGTLSFASAPHVDGQAIDVRALLGVGSIMVTGDMNDLFVLAGYDADGFPRTGNVSIGTVNIGGAFAGGGLLAGAGPGEDGITFTEDDVLIKPDPFPSIISKISNVIVGGEFNPFAIEAERLDAISIAGQSVKLTAGKHNDDFLIGDTIIKEVS